MAYAEGTQVSPEKSRAEIERTLKRYGCDGFMFGWEGRRAVLQFRAHDRYVRFILQMPNLADFAQTSGGRKRNKSQQEQAAEAEERRRWRSLALAIKAKLDAVESEIVTFEDEFMAHIVLPDGNTVGTHMREQIERAYSDGIMPSLLPALEAGE